MMSTEDREYVEQKLVNLIQGQATMRMTMVAYLPDEYKARVPEGQLAKALVTMVIDLCIEDCFARTPTTLDRLVRNLVGADDKIAAILLKAAIKPPAAADPFQVSILPSMTPFLDRTSLRDHTRTMAGPGRKWPLIVVTGNENSGKTCSGDYLEYICSTLPGVRCSRNELKPKQGRATGAAELARDLMTDVGGHPSALPPRTVNADSDVSNLERWTVELANEVIAQANKSGSRWWFILDGYNNGELRDDTKLFIVNFVNRLQAGMATQHRLILIDFDRAALSIKPGLIAPDITQSIPHSLVKSFVQEVAQKHPARPDASKLSDEVLKDLPDPIADLTKMGDRLSNLVLALQATP